MRDDNFITLLKNLVEEVHALKQAKHAGTLLTCYTWDSGEGYNWENRNYKITYGDGTQPVVARFSDWGTVTMFSPAKENGVTVQIFNMQLGGAAADRLIISATRPIVSVEAI